MRYTVIKSITLVSLVCMCAMSRDRAYKEERGGISYTLDLVSTTVVYQGLTGSTA
jgi:hypothetical protein